MIFMLAWLNKHNGIIVGHNRAIIVHCGRFISMLGERIAILYFFIYLLFLGGGGEYLNLRRCYGYIPVSS